MIYFTNAYTQGLFFYNLPKKFIGGLEIYTQSTLNNNNQMKFSIVNSLSTSTLALYEFKNNQDIVFSIYKTHI